MSNGCASTDSSGFRLLTSGSWNSGTTLNVQGGQGMHFYISNVNALGTTITITAGTGESHSSIIAPLGSADLNFSIFGNEPMGWMFNISTNSDAFIVTWCLYSTWLPGDANNPPPPPAIPTVTGVNPSSGSAGDTITITGSGFTGATGVGFGVTGASALSVTDTEITATVPAGSGTVDITIITPNGTSATNSADQFTYA
jgi:hypothetical protein